MSKPLSITTVISISFATIATAGEITTDGSMGTATNLTGPNYTIAQDLGTTVGNNLFHSFGTFNLSPGDVATFTGANTIQNVISRVTDGNPSFIDGTIESQVGNANFFFINPAGMVFGQHAVVDVPAAFHASTANELRFADGTEYNLVTPKGSLTAAPPEAFGFLGATGDIVIEGSQLKFKEGAEISFTGGSVISNSATIEVPRGSLRVYGNGDAINNVPINGELPGGNGAITMNGGMLDVSGNGGGNIQISGGAVSITNEAYVFNDNNGSQNVAGNLRITANTLLIDSSIVSTDTFSTGNAGEVVINVDENMQLLNHGWISSSTFAAGNAGSVIINTGGLTIDGIDAGGVWGWELNGTGIIAETQATGDAGSINIHINEAMQVLNGVWISSSNNGGTGNAGSIVITAASLTIDGGEDGHPEISVNAFNAGNAGSLTVNVNGVMQVLSGGQLSSNNFGLEGGGGVTITAGSLIIDGRESEYVTGITSDTFFDGNAGDVLVTITGNMQILNDGQVSSYTYAVGNAGTVNVTANHLVIDGQGSQFFTGIASDANENSSGNAGAVTVTVNGEMHILNSGTVKSSTFATGNGGTVNVTANRLIIDGQGLQFLTGIASDAELNSTGNAGTITITVNGEMRILNSGKVASDTYGTGNAGQVTVQAGSLFINDSKISSSTQDTSTGKAGDVVVTVTGFMQVQSRENNGGDRTGGQVTSDTYGAGDAGNVTVQAGSLFIDNGRIASGAKIGSTGGDAGNVSVTVTGHMQVQNGGRVSSNTNTTGHAGYIEVLTGSLTIDQQQSRWPTGILSITNASDTAFGNAGHVIIKVDGKLQILHGGSIESSNKGSGNAGQVNVSSGSLIIDGQGTARTGIMTTAQTGQGGNIIINAPAIVLNNGQITTSVLGKGGNGGDITLNGGYLVLDTGFIQANTEGEEAKGGNIFINMDGILSNGGITHIGGWKRETFKPNSGRNVIQAAAPGGESGNITFSNPNDDTASSIGASSNRLEPIKLATHPCEVIKGRFNFRRRGDVGLPNSGGDVIKFK